MDIDWGVDVSGGEGSSDNGSHKTQDGRGEPGVWDGCGSGRRTMKCNEVANGEDRVGSIRCDVLCKPVGGDSVRINIRRSGREDVVGEQKEGGWDEATEVDIVVEGGVGRNGPDVWAAWVRGGHVKTEEAFDLGRNGCRDEVRIEGAAVVIGEEVVYVAGRDARMDLVGGEVKTVIDEKEVGSDRNGSNGGMLLDVEVGVKLQRVVHDKHSWETLVGLGVDSAGGRIRGFGIVGRIEGIDEFGEARDFGNGSSIGNGEGAD